MIWAIHPTVKKEVTSEKWRSTVFNLGDNIFSWEDIIEYNENIVNFAGFRAFPALTMKK